MPTGTAAAVSATVRTSMRVPEPAMFREPAESATASIRSAAVRAIMIGAVTPVCANRNFSLRAAAPVMPAAWATSATINIKAVPAVRGMAGETTFVQSVRRNISLTAQPAVLTRILRADAETPAAANTNIAAVRPDTAGNAANARFVMPAVRSATSCIRI